jgi:hypothetical protein
MWREPRREVVGTETATGAAHRGRRPGRASAASARSGRARARPGYLTSWLPPSENDRRGRAGGRGARRPRGRRRAPRRRSRPSGRGGGRFISGPQLRWQHEVHPPAAARALGEQPVHVVRLRPASRPVQQQEARRVGSPGETGPTGRGAPRRGSRRRRCPSARCGRARAAGGAPACRTPSARASRGSTTRGGSWAAGRVGWSGRVAHRRRRRATRSAAGRP